MRGGRSIRHLFTASAVTIVLVATASVAWAGPGDPDTSFSGDGLRTIDFPGGSDDRANAVMVQANGRIVLGGESSIGGNSDFALLRLRANGTTDPSFSDDGFRNLDFRGLGGDDEILDLVQQPDGRIVAVGQAYNADGSSSGFAIARFRTDGRLDTSFSGDGKLLVSFPGLVYAFGYAVALQDDGRILVGGEAGGNAPTDRDFAVVRIKPRGRIDRTYGGGDGRVLTDFNGSDEGIWDMVVQPNGNLVAGGWAHNAAGDNYRFGFARYRSTGALDRRFSGDGRQVVDVSASLNDSLFGVEVRSDGRIVGAGQVGGPDIALVRLTPRGAPDPTFSGDGKLISEPLPGGVYGADLDLRGKKLVVAGYTTQDEIFLARYGAGGGLDTNFGGGDGSVVTTFPGATVSRVYRSAIQSDGGIVIAGYAVMTTSDFGVGRFLP